MKLFTQIAVITLSGFLPISLVHGQTSPQPAAGEKPAATAGGGKRTDDY